MKKQLLSVLAVASLVICSNQSVFATTQTIDATLGTTQSITVTTGHTVSTTMDGVTGVLATALDPTFTVSTNTPSTLSWSATVDTTTGYVDALVQRGTTYFIAMGNTTVSRKPTAAAVTDALAVTPTVGGADNFNVVAYALTGFPTTVTTCGSIDPFTFSATGGNHFEGVISGGTSGTVTATTVTAARPDTFCVGGDTAGSYQTVISLTFTS